MPFSGSGRVLRRPWSVRPYEKTVPAAFIGGWSEAVRGVGVTSGPTHPALFLRFLNAKVESENFLELTSNMRELNADILPANEHPPSNENP